jgi:phage terminase large subunit GpA-like protein
VTPASRQPQSPTDAFLAAFRRAIKPDRDFTVSEWADENRMLSSNNSPEPGRWRTDRTPYLRDVMNALSPQSAWQIVVLMAGSQIGKTECANNWLGYNIHIAPGPMLMVQPTIEMARRNSKQRIGPLIQDCEALRTLVAATDKRSGNSMLSKEFPGGVLVMAGANSSKGLRSMAARYLALDEVDGYPGDVEGEGDPCDLAMTRTVNFPRRKIFVTSTPVISGRSRIERFYEQSDQCLYYVPCPRCGEMQTLSIEQLRWPKGRPDKAVYVCTSCSAELQDSQKEYMLPKGEWRSHAKGDGMTRGYHLSSLYSPHGWLSWPQVAQKFEKAGKDPEKIQVLWNTVLGRPWIEIGETPDEERLYERREQYQIGRVPAGGLLLTAGADVQLRRIEVEVVAWGREKQSWSVDYRIFEGDTTQPEVWAKLAEMLDEEFETELGGTTQISRLAVDSGFQTSTVYGWVASMLPSRVMAVKGNTHASGLIGAPKLIEVTSQGRRIKFGLRLWPMNSNIAKEELYRWLRSAMPDLEAGEPWPVGYCHFPQYGKEYFEQLTAEHLITRTTGGLRKTVWEKRRDRNEALDCRLYARAAAASLRMDSWSEKRWADLEAALTLTVTKTSSAPAVHRTAKKPVSTASPMPSFRPINANDSFLE